MSVVGIANPQNNLNENVAKVDDKNINKAICVLDSTESSEIKGRVWLKEENGKTEIIAKISNLNKNKSSHSISINTFGDISSKNGSSISFHFNPYNHSHALPPTQNRHLGLFFLNFYFYF